MDYKVFTFLLETIFSVGIFLYDFDLINTQGVIVLNQFRMSGKKLPQQVRQPANLDMPIADRYCGV